MSGTVENLRKPFNPYPLMWFFLLPTAVFTYSVISFLVFVCSSGANRLAFTFYLPARGLTNLSDRAFTNA